jgi:hypothetical protein
MKVTFRDRLEEEFEKRRAVNARYSLRAFAALLEVDHASLSQVLRGKRSAPVERILSWGRKLKFSVAEIAVYAAVGRIADESARIKEEQLRHWAGEMLALLVEPAHRELLRLSRQKNFRKESQWIAVEVGVSVDHVNMALSRLLRLGLLEVTQTGAWRDTTGLTTITPQSFRKFIAERMPTLPDDE